MKSWNINEPLKGEYTIKTKDLIQVFDEIVEQIGENLQYVGFYEEEVEEWKEKGDTMLRFYSEGYNYPIVVFYPVILGLSDVTGNDEVAISRKYYDVVFRIKDLLEYSSFKQISEKA